MAPSKLLSLTLQDFKSHSGQFIEFSPVTLLVGRNGSGKSNVLDALSLLALLADGRDVRDLERDDLEVSGLRGGLAGAAPFGGGEIGVGCSVSTEHGERLEFSVTIDSVAGEIIRESLVLIRESKPELVLIDSGSSDPGSGIADLRVYSGGSPRTFSFLSSRLAVSQAASKVPQDTKARKMVVSCCNELIGALRGVFLLDPNPSEMRSYVRIGTPPDRSGSSLSALVHAIKSDHVSWERLLELVRGLIENRVEELTFVEAALPGGRVVDVMVAMREVVGEGSFLVPAQLMSDGTLRYLAIVSTLLSLRGTGDPGGEEMLRSTLVIEEIENGLFPSQGSKVLELLRAEASEHDMSLLATTHSPALLDALSPDDHEGVVICERNSEGRSMLRRLVDHPLYLDLASSRGVGHALASGKLDLKPSRRAFSFGELFD